MVSSQSHNQHPKSEQRKEEDMYYIQLLERRNVLYGFIVNNTRPGGEDIIFIANKGGIYYNDMRKTKWVYMISTVEKNLKHYTQRQYDGENSKRTLPDGESYFD